MPLFGDLHNDRALEFKYVLVAEKEELAAALSQLVVEEGIVIGLGRYGNRMEYTAGCKGTQVLSFERLAFCPRPQTLN